MNLPDVVIDHLINYGYLSIFILVFLQESGFPNPLPNEILLLFSGYLSYTGNLNIVLVIVTAAIADFAGTNILYYLFYHAGNYLIMKKPRWLPIPVKRLGRIRSQINQGNIFNIIIFRCTPFTRGYVSALAGLLKIRQKLYMPLAILTAILWSSFYVITGYCIAPSWTVISGDTQSFKYILAAIFVLALIIVTARQFILRKKIGGTNNSKCNMAQAINEQVTNIIK
jgi:membrane protein DedA with SNARE-associated domain